MDGKCPHCNVWLKYHFIAKNTQNRYHLLEYLNPDNDLKVQEFFKKMKTINIEWRRIESRQIDSLVNICPSCNYYILNEYIEKEVSRKQPNFMGDFQLLNENPI